MNDKTLEQTTRLGILALFTMIGEDSTRDGLKKTPERFVKAMLEMTSGYEETPEEILKTVFDEEADEMIILKNIEFQSLCEHHLLPFIGFATVAYIPGKVVGISKLARLVRCYAKRLQIQERMTNQIANAVEEHLDAAGVGVFVSAKHCCMMCRGINIQSSEMVTSALRGVMKSEGNARTEFLKVCG